ncbi:hypothetical protein DBR06_SOUSAS22610084, partial [Sousa chinensis]
MKPPERPAPGRTDRILGVMGGMLRACALPGQEGWILTGGRRGSGRSRLAVEGGFLTITLSPQPPKRSPLGLGGTEPESNCTEGNQRGEREREVPAWAPLPGKKLGVG